MQQLKRRLTMTLACLPFAALLTSCQSTPAPPLSEAQKRLKNIGLTLVVDAAQGEEMLGNELFADGDDFAFYAKSALKGGRNRDIMVFPMDAVPDQVRVIWRVKDTGGPFWWSSPDNVDDFGKPLQYSLPLSNPTGKESLFLLARKQRVERRKIVAKHLGVNIKTPWGGDYYGDILGDYTIPVASRIPDAVVRDIRKSGGSLRLKFRLKPDGVLFGWDIERFSGGLPRHTMPGGDFLDTEY